MQNKASQVKGLQKSSKKIQVLKGSVFALLGSNGGGKTTMVKVLKLKSTQKGGAI